MLGEIACDYEHHNRKVDEKGSLELQKTLATRSSGVDEILIKSMVSSSRLWPEA